MLNGFSVNSVQTAEEEGRKWGDILAMHTVTHTSCYYKISGQAVLKKVIERPLLLSTHFSPLLHYTDGCVDELPAGFWI